MSFVTAWRLKVREPHSWVPKDYLPALLMMATLLYVSKQQQILPSTLETILLDQGSAPYDLIHP